MNIAKNILAVVMGITIGSIVNMLLVMVSGSIIPPPEGANLTTVEGLKASMHLMEPKHFIFPFFAHALGVLVGAYIAARVAANHKMKFAISIGAFFIIGGIVNVVMLPSPTWFTIVDLSIAYIPMGWLGGKLAYKTILKGKVI